MKGNKNYNYILIDNMFYINIEQRFIELFLILYRTTKPFAFFERKTRLRLMNCLPSFLIRILRIVQFIYEFYKVKKDLKLRNSLPNITTQHFGQCLLKLRYGEIKVFNLKEKVVTTEFQSHVSASEIKKRLNTLRKVKRLAPKLINWSIAERYIVEEYINFRRSSYDLNNMEKYYSEVFPILEDIRAIVKPKPIDLQVYVQEQIIDLELKINAIPTSHLKAKIDKINDFISLLRDLFKRLQNKEGLLVLSHGDLLEGNILIKNDQSYIIDWESLNYRSFYFDFYYIMFMLASKNSHFDKVNKAGIDVLNKKLESSVNIFYDKAKDNNFYCCDKIPSLKQFEIHRYLFYLELIYLKFISQKDSVDKLVSETITWIKRFELYEKTFEI